MSFSEWRIYRGPAKSVPALENASVPLHGNLATVVALDIDRAKIQNVNKCCTYGLHFLFSV